MASKDGGDTVGVVVEEKDEKDEKAKERERVSEYGKKDTRKRERKFEWGVGPTIKNLQRKY